MSQWPRLGTKALNRIFDKRASIVEYTLIDSYNLRALVGTERPGKLKKSIQGFVSTLVTLIASEYACYA